jgi:tetratricopeptide (TPR) repeat protein
LSAAFSPDGRFVVTASQDSTARVWEAATGKAIGEPLRHDKQVLSAAFSPDGQRVLTASEDGTTRAWPWFKPLGDSPEKLAASIEQITFRKIAPDGGPQWIPPRIVLFGSQLTESFGWFAEPTRTRTVWPGALQTVPQFIMREIQEARRFREDRERAKRILDNAYPVDPAHPLIHLALAMMEDNKQTAGFLRDYDLKRLPESCDYTKDLDPKEVLKLAAEMCAEQFDRERLQTLWDKLVAAYRSAPEVGTTAELPQFWAMIQNNLGQALAALATRSSGEECRKLLEDAVAAYRSALEVRTKADQPDDQLRCSLAFALGNLGFNLILTGQFAEARTRCEEAQRLAGEIGDGAQKTDRDNLIFIQGNLAHALLFQGHYDEALALYRQYWVKPLYGKTFGELLLEDFAAFEKAGLTHPDLSRMKEALGNLPSELPSP